MTGTGAITLYDVAREVGVAKMTVSVVLNGSRSGTQVSEATRARIVEAAARLGYRRNGVARGLTRKRMDTIGVVAPNYGGMNLYVMEMFNGVLDEAALVEQSVNVLPVREWNASLQPKLSLFCDGRVDGVILISCPALEPGFLASIRSHTPLVTVHAVAPDPGVDDLTIDDEAGMCLITSHVAGLGHRRIAHLTGFLPSRAGEGRLAGYRRALADHGIPDDPLLVISPGSFAEDSGRERTVSLLDAAVQWPESSRPTAICCGSDAVAFGCLHALAGCGVRVPDQMSVTGFDDVLSARLGPVPLSTVRQPLAEMGARAVRLLLLQIEARLQHTDPPDAKREVFGVTLFPRATTAARPGRG
jgi:LacI family transcriptional regulator